MRRRRRENQILKGLIRAAVAVAICIAGLILFFVFVWWQAQQAYTPAYAATFTDNLFTRRATLLTCKVRRPAPTYSTRPRATVIEDYAFTITARQDRTPAQVIDMGNGRYRYLTELECWRLQGYTDADFKAAAAVHKRVGRYTMPLYKQAGNSIPVPIFESLFRKMILHETTESEAGNGNI